jgi:hypothetical protein
MKRYAIVLAVLMAVCRPAFADSVFIKSKVVEVNTTSNYLKAYWLNPQTEDTEEIRIDVLPSTLFKNAGSLSALKTGDEITAQTNYDNFTHEWTAIEITFVEPVPPAA